MYRLDCKTYRRFGVEIELNTSDGVVNKIYSNEIPNGIDYVAYLIKDTIHKRVDIRSHAFHHNNKLWIVKPDMSCGIEVCTPVLKGWNDLKMLLRVIQRFKEASIKSDERCSLHVHVNVADLSETQLAVVTAFYIKCEHLFFDAMPLNRKNNRYCKFIGYSDMFDTDTPMCPKLINKKFSESKYHSANAFHFMKSGEYDIENCNRPTMEFRIAGNQACRDPFFAKNWIRLLLHFVDIAKKLPMPEAYRKGDPWTGLAWLDPSDIFKLLQFDQPLSEGLKQTRNWLINSILKNGHDVALEGTWCNDFRHPARQNFIEMIRNFDYQQSETEETIFGDLYSI